ncbi:unnamed protein product [Closterium sp. NIES-65]|nr:unnamed protein product [Closterium sp. NIES-65]CAI5968490.1 unnamed protein product [Closterium sp. NIES-65]CAI5991019.1 unnamed protein product [Closterium sp. NIES-65]
MVESSVAQVGSGVRQLYGDLVRDLFVPAWDDDDLFAPAAPATAAAAKTVAAAAAAGAPTHVASHSSARKRASACSAAERGSKVAGRSGGAREAEVGGRATGLGTDGGGANPGVRSPSAAPQRASPASAQRGTPGGTAPPVSAALAGKRGTAVPAARGASSPARGGCDEGESAATVGGASAAAASGDVRMARRTGRGDVASEGAVKALTMAGGRGGLAGVVEGERERGGTEGRVAAVRGNLGTVSAPGGTRQGVSAACMGLQGLAQAGDECEAEEEEAMGEWREMVGELDALLPGDAGEAQGSSVGEEVQGSGVGEEVQGSSVEEEAQVSSVGEEAQGSSVGEEAQGSSVGEEAQVSSVGGEGWRSGTKGSTGPHWPSGGSGTAAGMVAGVVQAGHAAGDNCKQGGSGEGGEGSNEHRAGAEGRAGGCGGRASGSRGVDVVAQERGEGGQCAGEGDVNKEGAVAPALWCNPCAAALVCAAPPLAVLRSPSPPPQPPPLLQAPPPPPPPPQPARARLVGVQQVAAGAAAAAATEMGDGVGEGEGGGEVAWKWAPGGAAAVQGDAAVLLASSSSEAAGGGAPRGCSEALQRRDEPPRSEVLPGSEARERSDALSEAKDMAVAGKGITCTVAGINGTDSEAGASCVSTTAATDSNEQQFETVTGAAGEGGSEEDEDEACIPDIDEVRADEVIAELSSHTLPPLQQIAAGPSPLAATAAFQHTPNQPQGEFTARWAPAHIDLPTASPAAVGDVVPCGLEGQAPLEEEWDWEFV